MEARSPPYRSRHYTVACCCAVALTSLVVSASSHAGPASRITMWRGKPLATTGLSSSSDPSASRRELLSICQPRQKIGVMNRLHAIRGGSDGGDAVITETRDPSMKVKFQIVTAAGAKDLDQKMEMTLPLTTTVKELKGLIQAKFPGRPPAALQRLVYGLEPLKDDRKRLVDVVEGSPVIAPITLDMVPPLPALDYESCVELQEKLAAGTVYQQLNAYAATVVGLKHAQQALAEHLHRRATGEDEEEEDEEGEGQAGEEDEEDEEIRSATMKQEIQDLQQYMKQHYRKLPDTKLVVEDVGMLRGIVRDLDSPQLEHWLRLTATHLHMDVVRTARFSLAFFLFGYFGAQGATRAFLLAMVPGIFFLNLRSIRLGQKVAWELFRISPFAAGFFSALLSAPQQVILTLDEDAYVQKLYGDAEGGEQGRAALTAGEQEEDEEEEQDEEQEEEEEERESEEEEEEEEEEEGASDGEEEEEEEAEEEEEEEEE